jgi:glycosyl transferase family 87
MKRIDWLLVSCPLVLLLLLGPTIKQDIDQFRAALDPSQTAFDFRVYYVAGKVARQQGPLYYPPAGSGQGAQTSVVFKDVDEQTAWGRTAQSLGFVHTPGFVAPPFTALLIEPLTALSPRTALLLWQAVSLALLVLSVFLVVRLVNPDPFWPYFVMGTAAALSFYPSMLEFSLGQIEFLILFLWTLGAFLAGKKRTVGSAFCFALGTMIKLQPAVVVGVFLLRRQWKWCLAFAAWTATLLSISLWQLGWQNHVVYFRQILPTLSCGVPGYFSNSLATLVENCYFGRVPALIPEMPGLIPAALCWLTKALSLGLYGAVLLCLRRKNKQPTQMAYELALLTLVLLLISPISWRNHSVLAILPLLYLWLHAGRNGGDWKNLELIALGAATLLIGTPYLDHLAVRVIGSAHPVLEILLTGSVCIATSLLVVASLLNYPEAGAGKAV